MPGLANCGRCGASLLIGQTDIDVHPPRASTRRKQLRRWFPSVHGFRERIHTLGTALVKGVSHNEQPPEWPVVWRMIIPGWAHRYSGYHIRAMIFFFSYLALLLSGLYFIGTNRGGLLLGLAFSCHASSILDLTILYYHSLRDRIVLGLFTFFALLFVVYIPAWWGLSQVAQPVPITLTVPPLQQGDVLLTQTLSDPEVGDVVVYEIPPITVTGTTPQGYAANIQVEGRRVDRILAGPGQTVEIELGKILIDGRPTEHQPLNPARSFMMPRLTVGARQWFILPSTEAYADQAERHLPRLSLVSWQQVHGTVWFRSQPFSRMGRLTSLSAEDN